MIKWLAFVAWNLFGISTVATADQTAYNLADNPAFCFGLLSAPSQTDTDTLAQRKAQISALFAKFGP